MNKIILLVFSITLFTCNSEQNKNGDYNDLLREHRKTKHKKMVGESSPLPKSERKNFIGLNYYPIDTNWNKECKFTLLFNQVPFKMQTNTERTPNYIAFASIEFEHNNSMLQLIAYKDLDNASNDLFIPFTDLSNGNETYHSGRYLDIETPEGTSIQLDFNKCYNPYCAYNKKYSCPIPPQENRLPIKVAAGERLYH